jgi:hypothetical protein
VLPLLLACSFRGPDCRRDAADHGVCSAAFSTASSDLLRVLATYSCGALGELLSACAVRSAIAVKSIAARRSIAAPQSSTSDRDRVRRDRRDHNIAIAIITRSMSHTVLRTSHV